MPPLRLITYLAPSLPPELFRLIADDLGAELIFEERISGPLEGDHEPFTSGEADLGFVCAPSYRWLRGRVELLPLLVPNDGRAAGRPVYFSDVIVRRDAAARSLQELRGGRWAYNDRNSRSGWFSMVERIAPAAPEEFFGELIAAGSHLRSIELVASGGADAAAIDSNALRLHHDERVRAIESWGPFAIQPAIVRNTLDATTKECVAAALLSMHERHGAALDAFGFSRFIRGDDSLY